MTTTELRLHVVTLLAGVYLLAWRAMIRPPEAPQPAPTAAPAPALVVPPGWRVARTHITPTPTPRVQPAPPRRRVRTRSS